MCPRIMESVLQNPYDLGSSINCNSRGDLAMDENRRNHFILGTDDTYGELEMDQCL